MRACVRACVHANVLVRSFIDWSAIAHAQTKTMNPKRVAFICLRFFAVVVVVVVCLLFFFIDTKSFIILRFCSLICFFYNKSPCGLQLNCTVNMNATNVTVQIKSQITIVCYIVYDMCLESKVEMRFTLQSVQSIDKPHLIIWKKTHTFCW